MVELAPTSFLDGDWPPKAQQLEAASALLRRELEGADLDFMFQVGVQRAGGEWVLWCGAVQGRSLSGDASGQGRRRRWEGQTGMHWVAAHLPALAVHPFQWLSRRTQPSCLSRWTRCRWAHPDVASAEQLLRGGEIAFGRVQQKPAANAPLTSCTSRAPRQVGLRRLRELWPGLTPQALGNSEPLHLSLAVKALGLSGPPKGF